MVSCLHWFICLIWIKVYPFEKWASGKVLQEARVAKGIGILLIDLKSQTQLDNFNFEIHHKGIQVVA